MMNLLISLFAICTRFYDFTHNMKIVFFIVISVSRENNEWTLKIDNLEKKEAVNNRTDVQLFSKPAFIGGRPSQ